MNPRFIKLRRHAFVALISLITIREVTFTYQSGLSTLKIGGLLLTILYFFINLYPANLILKKWFPICLNERKFLRFFLLSSSIVLSSILLKLGIELFLTKLLNLNTALKDGFGYIAFWEACTLFITTLTCIYGLLSLFLLKIWIKEKKKIKEIESEQIQSELESLKEQVDTGLLLDTLQNTSELVLTNQEQANEQIKLLSTILRYELYDSKRSLVLLTPEITFINNVLKLWSYQLNGLEYSITTEGNTQATLLPPLLITSLIQVIIHNIEKADSKQKKIDITISVHEKVISVRCLHNGLKEKVTPSTEMQHRLNILFGQKWTISSDLNHTELKIDTK